MLRKLKNQIIAQNKALKSANAYRELIRQEAIIGGTLFGALPKGHRRDFFCLDEHTWIWHEEWLDHSGERQIRTTRYDVRPSGVVKIQDGNTYRAINPAEARNLREAIGLYYKRVMSELYCQPN